MENPYLFGEKFEEKPIKIISAKQKWKSISPTYNKENQPSLRGQTITSPFFQARYQETNKEEVQVVEGEDSFSQEQQQPEVRTYQVQFPQKNLEIHSPEICSHIHPTIKGLFPPNEFQKFPQAGRLRYFLKNWEKLNKGLLHF